MTTDRQVMVRVAPDIADQLKEIADREERTVSQTIRLAIKQYLATQGRLAPS